MADAIHEARMKEFRHYRDAADTALDRLTDALCQRYFELTGKRAPQKLWDEFWEACRHHQ